MRGVEKQNSQTVTSSMLGSFSTDPSTRAELMNLLRDRR
jgi:GTP cyclohydrolase IA